MPQLKQSLVGIASPLAMVNLTSTSWPPLAREIAEKAGFDAVGAALSRVVAQAEKSNEKITNNTKPHAQLEERIVLAAASRADAVKAAAPFADLAKRLTDARRNTGASNDLTPDIYDAGQGDAVSNQDLNNRTALVRDHVVRSLATDGPSLKKLIEDAYKGETRSHKIAAYAIDSIPEPVRRSVADHAGVSFAKLRQDLRARLEPEKFASVDALDYVVGQALHNVNRAARELDRIFGVEGSLPGAAANKLKPLTDQLTAAVRDE